MCSLVNLTNIRREISVTVITIDLHMYLLTCNYTCTCTCNYTCTCSYS